MGVLEVGGYAKFGIWCWEPTGDSCCYACHYSLPCALGVMGGAQGLDWVGGDGLAILKDQGLPPMFCLYTILLFWCCWLVSLKLVLSRRSGSPESYSLFFLLPVSFKKGKNKWVNSSSRWSGYSQVRPERHEANLKEEAVFTYHCSSNWHLF